MWGPSTPNPTQVSGKTLILKKLANSFSVMWICGGLASCGPSALLATKIGRIWKEDTPFGNPPYHGTESCGLFKKYIFLTGLRVRSGVWVKKRYFRVFWTRCEVADLKQRKETTAMDHRNKIQSLVLPTYDPGDTPDCITEYGPHPANMATHAINQPIFKNKGFR